MKRLKTILSICTALLLAGACSDDDNFDFVAAPDADGIRFTNTFAAEYLLSSETSSNIAERFVWDNADFGAPTPAQYDLEASMDEAFANIEVIGTTSGNNLEVKVSTLLGFAELMGLDDDPGTTDPDSGDPNNTGVVYFRVKAYPGDGQSGSSDTYSPVQPLNIVIIEQAADGGTGLTPASWGVVGSGANNWGSAGPDLPFYTTNQSDVFVAYVNLIDGEIKFRENNDWGSNLGDNGADGTVEFDGANIAVTAGDYKITLDVGASTYTIEPFTLGVVGSAWNDWGGAGPDAKMFYDYTSDSFVVGVKLMDGEMKVRLNNDWGTNYGDTGNDGTFELNGDNIPVTAGFYQVRIDLNNATIAVEPADIYGVVGSGYNDWGGAGPDFSFSQYNPDKWVAQNVTLVDGEIKFRINEDWGTNYGDTGADGTLDINGDNIAVTAGTYDIFLDFSEGTPTYSLITK